MYNFSLKKIFTDAFRIFGQNFTGIFMLSILSVTLISFVQISADTFIISNFGVLMPKGGAVTTAEYFMPLFGIFIYTFTVFFMHALVFFLLTSAVMPLFENKELKLKNFFPPLKIILKFIAGIIILMLPFGVSLLLFFMVTSAPVTSFFVENGLLSVLILIPVLILAVGIAVTIVMLRYAFFYIALFEGARVSAAFAKSAAVTLGKRKKIFFLLLLLLIFNFLGRIFIIGTVVTIPVSALALLCAYFKLNEAYSPENE